MRALRYDTFFLPRCNSTVFVFLGGEIIFKYLHSPYNAGKSLILFDLGNPLSFWFVITSNHLPAVALPIYRIDLVRDQLRHSNAGQIQTRQGPAVPRKSPEARRS